MIICHFCLSEVALGSVKSQSNLKRCHIMHRLETLLGKVPVLMLVKMKKSKFAG